MSFGEAEIPVLALKRSRAAFEKSQAAAKTIPYNLSVGFAGDTIEVLVEFLGCDRFLALALNQPNPIRQLFHAAASSSSLVAGGRSSDYDLKASGVEPLHRFLIDPSLQDGARVLKS